MAINWLKIKTEYISGNVSQRELAKKYDVTLRQISNHATSEGWVAEREQHRDRLSTEIQQKTDEKIVESESEVLAIKSRLKLKMYQQIEKRMGSVDEVDGQEFRRLVQNYKDMCDIQDADSKQQTEIEDLTPLAEMLKK